MNAIIIAAGSGKRISRNIKEIPKSMVKINEKPIIEYQILALKQAGINDICVITGPYSEKFHSLDVTYVKDQNYENHDILGSLMEAKKFLKNDTLVLYSDILFESNIIFQILESKEDISIAIDLNQTPPEWINSVDRVISAINSIRPINTVFDEISGFSGISQR